MAAHLLIVDALNLIRRIHAVQGSPCVETCQHALDQLIIHSQPTHAVAVFDDDARSSGWRHQRLPDYKAGRPPMPDDLHNEMPALPPHLNSAAYAVGHQTVTKRTIWRRRWR